MQRSQSDAFQSVGKTLGKYRILDGLALGGMAEIYLARLVGTHATDKHVVIKQLKPHLAEDPAFVKMFLDEARLATQLNHRNIGQVLDVGDSHGLYYFAMEYLHGFDTRTLFQRVQQKQQRIPYEHAITLIADTAAALHYAHERYDKSGKPLAIVHRDISPSNIFVTYTNGVKLVDFGLAQVADQGSQSSTMVQGKAAYFSPEQCRSERLDRRSDIFSLGIVLYELTTGERLFRRKQDDNFAIMNRILKGEITPPSSLPQSQNSPYPIALEDVVMQALAIDKKERYASAKDLILELEAVADVEGLSLSSAALSHYMEKTLGKKTEPWRELSPEDDNAFDGELTDGFEEPPAPDEFDDEVATSLYTGNIEDIQNAWAMEAIGRRTPKEPSRLSQSRIALPLQAEDSDSFKNPLAPEILIDDDDDEQSSSIDHLHDQRDPSDPALLPPRASTHGTAPGPTSQPRDISTIGGPLARDPSQAFQLPPLLPQSTPQPPTNAHNRTTIIALLAAVILIVAIILFLIANA